MSEVLSPVLEGLMFDQIRSQLNICKNTKMENITNVRNVVSAAKSMREVLVSLQSSENKKSIQLGFNQLVSALRSKMYQELVLETDQITAGRFFDEVQQITDESENTMQGVTL